MAGRISYLGGIVTQGLVLDLDAAKRDSYVGTGVAWNDISGNQNNGTLINGPTFNSANGGSIVFDGSNDYASISDSSTLRGFTGITLSAWVNKKTKDIKIFGKWTGGAGPNNYILREVTGTLQFYINTTSFVGGNIGINPATGWNLYTATWDGSTMKAYLNSTVSSTTYSQTGTIPNTGPNLIIGAEYDISLNSDASIAQTLIYNRALSATEILQNYNATKTRYL
jgi:hypothetical protein